MRTQAGPAAGVQIGVAIDHQQAQPAQIVQDRVQRREFTPVELARPAMPDTCSRSVGARLFSMGSPSGRGLS